ncbi:MAG: dihydropteroate synthase [Clostridia bacterium]|nr:dihydropteroate synthase [Clostridia bacterium]
MSIFNAGRFSLAEDQKTYIMGILNVTPDSFSDGGKFFSVKNALMQTEKMINDGADIIDVGAVSTRPFSDAVSPQEEWGRLEKVLFEIRRNFSVPVSVDTFSPYTAIRCLDAGVDIINDVSGVFSSEMAEIIKKYDCGWIMMHGGVGLRRAEEETVYEKGIIKDVNDFFSDMKEKAVSFGISSERLCFDPGFGFSKNTAQNTELLKNFDKLQTDGCALLCGLSRKRFIGEITETADASDRDAGTLAADIIASIKGADIVRVHNVAIHKKAFSIFDEAF